MRFFSFIASILLTSSLAQAEGLDSLINDGSQKGAVEAKAAAASTWSLNLQRKIKNLTADQNAFVRAMESEKWDQASLLYSKAFEGTAFQKSDYGQALNAFVLFKAGLHTTAIEKLFQVENPQNMDELKVLMVQMMPEGFYAWDLVKIQWKAQWTNVFGHAIEYQVKAQAIQDLNSIEALKKLSNEAPIGSLAKARIDWKLILTYALNDKADEAAKLLVQLMKQPKAPVSQDLMQLTAARLLYQNGYFDAAIRYYEKVSKNSELWVEAQEEIAWAYIRKGQPQNAVAATRALDSNIFDNQIRPEAFLASSVAGLKICDYPVVVKTLERFPKSFKNRTSELESLAKNKSPENLNAVIDLLENKKITVKDLGKRAEALPRMTARDSKLYDYAQAAKNFTTEAKVAEILYARSLAATGLQSYFENLNKSLQMKAQAARAAGVSRIRELAASEVEETKAILRKMHIVEAEIVQQVAMADTLVKNSVSKEIQAKNGTTGAQGPDTLKFAANDEVWMDEISNYRVDVKKACFSKR